MLQCLVVFLQLRENGTDVQVSACESYLVSFEVDFHLQGTSKVTERTVQLAHLLVVTTQVVARHREKARVLSFGLDDSQTVSHLPQHVLECVQGKAMKEG